MINILKTVFRGFFPHLLRDLAKFLYTFILIHAVKTPDIVRKFRIILKHFCFHVSLACKNLAVLN